MFKIYFICCRSMSMNGSDLFSTDHHVDLQRVQECNLPSVIKGELEKFLTWDFDCSRFENKHLFKSFRGLCFSR